MRYKAIYDEFIPGDIKQDIKEFLFNIKNEEELVSLDISEEYPIEMKEIIKELQIIELDMLREKAN